MNEQQESVESGASPEEAEAVATLAYDYGFPLVLMDVSREVMTAVPSVEAQKGPINQFIHVETFPDDTFRDVVSPNVDTLYSTAWLDLGAEPIVLQVPDVGRAFLPDADLRRLDERVRGAGHTHDRESCRGLRPGRTRTGVARCPRTSRRSPHRPTSSGSSDARSPPARPTTPRSTRFNISTSWFRSVSWGRAYTPPAKVAVASGIDTQDAARGSGWEDGRGRVSRPPRAAHGTESTRWLKTGR